MDFIDAISIHIVSDVAYTLAFALYLVPIGCAHYAVMNFHRIPLVSFFNVLLSLENIELLLSPYNH